MDECRNMNKVTEQLIFLSEERRKSIVLTVISTVDEQEVSEIILLVTLPPPFQSEGISRTDKDCKNPLCFPYINDNNR